MRRTPGEALLTENICDRFLLYIWCQVPVSVPLLVRLVANEVIDDPLVHAGRCQTRNKTVPQYVTTSQYFPFGVSQCPLEMIVDFIPG